MPDKWMLSGITLPEREAIRRTLSGDTGTAWHGCQWPGCDARREPRLTAISSTGSSRGRHWTDQVDEQARHKSRAFVSRVTHTMALEDQKASDHVTAALLEQQASIWHDRAGLWQTDCSPSGR